MSFFSNIPQIKYEGKETKNPVKKNEKISEEKKDNGFVFLYRGINVTPGQEFKEKAIDEEASYMELESCAFDGNDKVYTYTDVEITVSEMKGKDVIYTIYFLNETISTTEGVKVSDEKAIMIERYGESYEKINNKYVYKKGDVIVSFIVENDTIVSIEYRVDVKQ